MGRGPTQLPRLMEAHLDPMGCKWPTGSHTKRGKGLSAVGSLLSPPPPPAHTHNHKQIEQRDGSNKRCRYCTALPFNAHLPPPPPSQQRFRVVSNGLQPPRNTQHGSTTGRAIQETQVLQFSAVHCSSPSTPKLATTVQRGKRGVQVPLLSVVQCSSPSPSTKQTAQMKEHRG